MTLIIPRQFVPWLPLGVKLEEQTQFNGKSNNMQLVFLIMYKLYGCTDFDLQRKRLNLSLGAYLGGFRAPRVTKEAPNKGIKRERKGRGQEMKK